MQFYDRINELKSLEEIKEMSQNGGQMTVLTGRRRIGKTALLIKSCEGQPTLYFFVTRKSEVLLCNEFVEEIHRQLDMPCGNFTSFGKLFEYLMQLSVRESFNLVIDEFQEFDRINPAVFGEMQHYWDIYKDRCKMNLLISGSVHSLMHKIFEDRKEPLFSRAGRIIRLKPFGTDTLKKILADHNPDYNSEDLLALYTFTGGVAWYVELFVKYNALTFNKMLNFITREDAPFLTEGKNLLVEEFGKDYAIYFSILECVARGLTSRTEIESYIGGKDIGGYLAHLENDYFILSQKRPIFAKPSSRQVRYYIADNFLSFWFRFVYKYQNLIESGNVAMLKEIIRRDYPTFSGLMLERYFRDHYIELGKHTHIGSYWDRKGENEIDLVAVNEFDKNIEIIEIKRTADRINLNVLETKGKNFIAMNDGIKHFNVTYKGLSMSDM